MILKNHIVAFGYRNNAFIAYKIKDDLKTKDSLVFKLVSFNKNEYLQVEADTLNGYLNFYLHKKNNQALQVIIADTSLKFKTDFKNIDVTKLKPFSGLTEQTFHSGKHFYIIKTAVDSAGKHYYLTQYGYMPGEKTPFDYRFNWQFNFDRSHITYAHVFFADKKGVYVYVNVDEGLKKGQWILILNAQNGLLLRSKRLNFHPELNYRFCNYLKDSSSKSIYILGQITQGTELASATPSIYLAGFDSSFEYTGQKQFTIKISSASKTKQVNKYLLQFPFISTGSDNQFTLFPDIFKKDGNSYKYHMSAGLSFTLSEGEWQSPEMLIREFPEIENFYAVKDIKDPNGKIENDSASGQNKLYHNKPLFPVKTAFRLTENNMPEWCLQKLDMKSNMLKTATLKPGLKAYSMQTLIELPKATEPKIFVLNRDQVLITGKPDEFSLELVIKKW